MRREGFIMNHKKLRRLYREERLQVRRRSGRKGALGTRAPMIIPQDPNQRWSLDLSDAFADGRRFRILAVVDDFTRERLAPVADTRPAVCVSDNGTELTGIAILRWTRGRGSRGTTSRQANRNRTTERLHRKFQRPTA